MTAAPCRAACLAGLQGGEPPGKGLVRRGLQSGVPENGPGSGYQNGKAASTGISTLSDLEGRRQQAACSVVGHLCLVTCF